MAKVVLHGAQVRAFIGQVEAAGVPERVGMHVFEAGAFRCRPADGLRSRFPIDPSGPALVGPMRVVGILTAPTGWLVLACTVEMVPGRIGVGKN